MSKIVIPFDSTKINTISDKIIQKLSHEELLILKSNLDELKNNIKIYMRNENIKAALKDVLPENVLTQMLNILHTTNITTPLRMAHFLAQCAHESGDFRHIFENLNYSAQGLLRVFPRHFGTLALAKLYERNPVKIGSRVYANRMGNGDEKSGDGFKFRGRGFIQLTGRNNYVRFSEFVGEDVVENPDLVALKYPLTSALFYFERNNLWQVADRGAGEAVIKEMTKLINGGFNGLNDRMNKFNRYYKALKDVDFYS